MSDDSTGSSDDLWANTRPEPDTGETPTTPTGEQQGAMPPPDPDATTVQPSAGGPPPPAPPPPGGEPPPTAEPTTVQPAVGPPGVAAGAAGGYVAGGGVPPEPPIDGYGDDFDEPPDWRPRWLLPAAIALLVALIIGLIAVLATRDSGDDESDETTTTSSEVSTTTEPVFVPVDSGANTTSTAAPTTAAPTTEAPTTLAPTTQPPTTQPPTTQPPTTQPPTTQPPTTQPPTTVPAFPDPGFAFVDDQTLPIQTTCRVDPDDGDKDIVAYVVDSASGRMVIERWFGNGSNGVDVDLTWTDQHAAASPVDSATVTDPFSTTATGDFTVEVAVNPPSGGPDNCQDSIQTSDGSTTHDYAVVDVCKLGEDVAGIGTEGSRFGAADNGDGTAQLVFSDRTTGPLTDPAATVTIAESIYNYEGQVTGGG